MKRKVSGPKLNATEIQERYTHAQKVLAKVPASMDYTIAQFKALTFLIQLFNTLCDEHHEDKALEVYKYLHPLREYINFQLMNLEVDSGDPEDLVIELTHRLEIYALKMLTETPSSQP